MDVILQKINEDFKNIQIEIYEKNNDILTEAGKNNQYRLHLGFHYPRSLDTIKQTQRGSKIFIKEFKNFISKPKKNIYLIHKQSLISFTKYKNIFKKLRIKFKEINLTDLNFLKDIRKFQGAINTNEQVILLDKLIPKIKKSVKKKCKIYFKNEIKKINFKTSEIVDNKNKFKKFDYIINTTYTNPNLGLKKNIKLSMKLQLWLKLKTH